MGKFQRNFATLNFANWAKIPEIDPHKNNSSSFIKQNKFKSSIFIFYQGYESALSKNVYESVSSILYNLCNISVMFV